MGRRRTDRGSSALAQHRSTMASPSTQTHLLPAPVSATMSRRGRPSCQTVHSQGSMGRRRTARGSSALAQHRAAMASPSTQTHLPPVSATILRWGPTSHRTGTCSGRSPHSMTLSSTSFQLPLGLSCTSLRLPLGLQWRTMPSPMTRNLTMCCRFWEVWSIEWPFARTFLPWVAGSASTTA